MMSDERYRREVLWSILNDAINEYRREFLRPNDLLIVDEPTHQPIEEYLGVLEARLPLAGATIREIDDDHFQFEQLIDEAELRVGVTEFLVWLTERGIERNSIQPATERSCEAPIADVASGVASRWQRMGFN